MLRTVLTVAVMALLLAKGQRKAAQRRSRPCPRLNSLNGAW